jgi:hypothetical protein
MFEGEIGLDQRCVLRQPSLVLSIGYRDRSPHLGSVSEKLNDTAHQEQGIRNPMVPHRVNAA